MGRRRRRRKSPPHTDPRVQSIYARRFPGVDEPEWIRQAVDDVITEGDPLFLVDHLYRPSTLRDIWKHRAGFMVCGGPSLDTVCDKERLRDRGIVSLGVNNVSGHAPVSAFVASDPPMKFHHGIWMDPKVMKLVPIPKLKKGFRIKEPNGRFTVPKIGPDHECKVRDCPNIWGFKRSCEWDPPNFLRSNAATWGNNAKAVERNGRDKLLFTMLLGIRLVYYLGLRRVYLLGADFNMKPKGGYSFGQERTGGASRSNMNSYRTANKWLIELRPILEAAGMEVYNCNQQSRLEAFDYVPFEYAYQDCRGPVPAEPFDLTGWYEKDSGRGTDQRTG